MEKAIINNSYENMTLKKYFIRKKIAKCNKAADFTAKFYIYK